MANLGMVLQDHEIALRHDLEALQRGQATADDVVRRTLHRIQSYGGWSRRDLALVIRALDAYPATDADESRAMAGLADALREERGRGQ